MAELTRNSWIKSAIAREGRRAGAARGREPASARPLRGAGRV